MTNPQQTEGLTAEILPCPFCGRPPHVEPSGDGSGVMISCLTKGCVNPHTSYYGDGVAAKVWNFRPSPPAQEAVAWRSPQQSKSFPWAFAWDKVQLDAWRDILGIEGEPLYTSPPDQSSLIKVLTEALDWYAEQFCEYGTGNAGCGKYHEDTCSGCRARKALSMDKDGN